MRATRGQSPDSAEVMEHLRQVGEEHPQWATVKRVATTREGRPVCAVTITDPGVPGRDKQHVLITAGHHGNEESGRLIALALLDWLVSSPAAETRRKQKVVIMPNMCPDLAERDQYVPENGTSPMRDHGEAGPETPEGTAFQRLAYALQPELYVDMHSRGFAGCSYDMVLWSEPRTYLEDSNLLHRIAAEMAESGERTGIPHLVHPLSWPGFMSESPDLSSSCAFTYREFKSLSFLSEAAEDNTYAYPVAARAQSGVARMRSLLGWGNRRHPKLRYSGYPCYLVGGMFAQGLVAVGATAAARRRSRVSIWRSRGGFASFGVVGPEKPTEKVLRVDYQGEALGRGVGFQCAVRGRRKIARVSLNGRQLRISETNGCYAWCEGAMTFIVVALRQLPPGQHEVVIVYR